MSLVKFLNSLEVNETIEMDNPKSVASIRVTCSKFGKKTGRKFTVAEFDGGVVKVVVKIKRIT